MNTQGLLKLRESSKHMMVHSNLFTSYNTLISIPESITSNALVSPTRRPRIYQGTHSGCGTKRQQSSFGARQLWLTENGMFSNNPPVDRPTPTVPAARLFNRILRWL